jgi:hypothetical protein
MKKTIVSLMLVAVAATAFTACNKEAGSPVPEKTLVTKTVRLSAVVKDDESKATFTTADDKTFVANWEIGDRMSVDCYMEGSSEQRYSLADWDGSAFVFTYDVSTDEGPGVCHYYGRFPADLSFCPFEKYRTQIGNNYNSRYDLMTGSVTYENALLGENPDGGNIVIPMERLTSIVYFHLTSDLDEPISTAKLTVEGGDIAANYVRFNDGVFEMEVIRSNSIVISFPEGQAPSARDFQLWYNILPVEATSLTLTVTTDTKIATLRNTKGKSYVAGKVNKIVKNGLNWTDNPDEPEALTVAQFLEKEPGSTYYKLNGTVENYNKETGSFYLNDGTGSVFINSVTERDDPGYSYSYCNVYDGDEVTLSGTRSERNGEALIRYAYHISHVYYPHIGVEPSVFEFDADAIWQPIPLEVWALHFDSVFRTEFESSAGDDSRFIILGGNIYSKVPNTSIAPYSEIFTATVSDGKNTLQKQFEVRQKGLGLSSDMDITFNGYNEEKNL